jgi:HEPN domain-containing protein
MKDRIEYWIELSDYNLETAKAMLVTKRFLYVGFMCHQSIEKIFKAYYVKIKRNSTIYTQSFIPG